MKNRITQALILALGLSFASAYAKEGADQYPFGAENWLCGAVPPPGTYFLNYLGYYGGQLKDGSGSKVNLGGTTPSVDAVFDALRIIKITKFKILGGTWGVHAIAPFVEQSMNLGGRNSRVGAGDITLDPFVLGWHGENWHAATAMDFLIPTGHFDKNDPRVSIGANYYSFEPAFAVSYFPKKTWETSAKLMYNTKTTNQQTNYHSGDEFHADYVAGKHFAHGWSAGASGYVDKQLTNDTIAGQTAQAVPGLWTEGRMGQVVAVGPSISYTNKSHMSFIAQWHHEMLVRNRFGGDKFWFKAIFPL
jgi:hypothetical protein